MYNKNRLNANSTNLCYIHEVSIESLKQRKQSIVLPHIDVEVHVNMYIWDYTLCVENWSSEVKDIISIIGLSNTFKTREKCFTMM